MSNARKRAGNQSPKTTRAPDPEGTARHRAGRPGVGPVVPGLQLTPATVTGPGDRSEREADRAADRIVQGLQAEKLSRIAPGATQLAKQAPPVPAEEVDEQGGIIQRAADVAPTIDRGPEEPNNKAQLTRSPVEIPRPTAGEPLASGMRSRLETGLDADLGDVRVHDDAAANATADAMGAKAFTRGSDIWLGSGQSSDDLWLMAHEAAHVVQQEDTPESVVQAATKNQKNQKDQGEQEKHPAVDEKAKLVTVPEVSVPKEKRDATAAYLKGDGPAEHVARPIGEKRPKTKQLSKWKRILRNDDDFKGAVSKKLCEAANKGAKDGDDNFYLRHKKKPDQLVAGKKTAIRDLGMVPQWDKQGRPTSFDVDHKVEMQFGGPGLDTLSNYWLLEQQYNRSSGSKIMHEINRRIDDTLRDAVAARTREPKEDKDPQNALPRNRDEAASKGWKFQVAAVAKEPLGVEGHGDRTWEFEEVKAGKPIEELEAVKPTGKEGGTEAELALFMGRHGGNRFAVKWGDKTKNGVRNVSTDDDKKAWWFFKDGSKETASAAHNNFKVNEIAFDNVSGGSVTGTLFKENTKKGKEPFDELSESIKIVKYPSLDWTGFLDPKRLLDRARSGLNFDGMSPVLLDQMAFTLEKGLVGRGQLMPTIPLIADAAIDIVIDGNDVYLSKVFSVTDFDFPVPGIDVTGCSLELQLGLSGFQILGEVNFEIDKLGTGRVHAEAGARRDGVDFALGGEFDFLSDIFEPARIQVWYKDREFGGRGELGIRDGKVKGLKTANVTAEIDREGIRAEGTFTTTIPGVESGSLHFSYDAGGEVELGGSLAFGSKIPGIRGGRVDARLLRDTEGEWKVFGGIQATPSIPGLGGQITGTYDDGELSMQAQFAYERGMAAGALTVGVTNRGLDEDGNPTGEPGDELYVFGGGEVGLTLAPWLKATAGLHLLPNGEIEVVGRIQMPESLELAPRKDLGKDLFRIGIDIPILGVSVAGQNIGIFATIAGRAQLLAFVGPLAFTDLSLTAKWNPDHEDQTEVSGHAALQLPAGAGVRLAVSAALGAGLAVVSARLGLELGGYLGVEAAIGAGVDIDWTPSEGLVLSARAEAYAEPVFVFDVRGFFRVDLDLLLTTKNLYEKEWNLASLKLGSGLRLGMSLPITYHEGEPFQPSLSDVEFQVPDIDPQALFTGLFDHIT